MSEASQAGQNRADSKALPDADSYLAVAQTIEILPSSYKKHYNIPQGVSDLEEWSDLYDLEKAEIQNKIKHNVDRLSETDLKDVWDIIVRKLDYDVGAALPPLPEKAPALWSERTTGRDVRPSDFIQEHYGKWIGKGLAREHLMRLDRALYNSYAKQIEREPDRKLPLIQSAPNKIADPVEAIERKRQVAREASARYRSKVR